MIHTIGDDNRLISLLGHELRLRGTLPAEGSTSEIVLFVEQSSVDYINRLQDSFYGSSDFATPVVVPHLKNIGSTRNDTETDNHEDLSAVKPSVHDYLERSMAEFRGVTASRNVRPSRVSAVGIIGSEWADENLILKKARQVFPTATFFTMEVDARFNPISQASRNLPLCSAHASVG
ncbi:hypothetical protein [Allorhodopirellula solitaria]|uniref:Uncharacterized protein n=1 Tax=Allorhodopirellula solitaria TaxID=2527987 RepID=A0A5C5XQC3_9BACT|nr:hypothetical protein [Allorhodopirellula solitaria]TWT65094.1 hypothetical protein CA85_34400 [Allorhodopirellula solitaria]